MQQITLLMVVEVNKEKWIRCDYKQCNHGVYKRIHIVRFEDLHYECLGSSCYKKLIGQNNVKVQQANSVNTIGMGKLLTDEQRALLLENKRQLLEDLLSAKTHFVPNQKVEVEVEVEVEAQLIDISTAALATNYTLIPTYIKFNPNVDYSQFPDAEKYSRALDMVNRRYRDEGLSINPRSNAYQNEIRALMDDMVDLNLSPQA